MHEKNFMTTLRDVAKRAGVGNGTVSRVLNGGSVAPETRSRVEAAMRELEFSPNAMAQGIRSRSSRLVGCVISDIANPLYAAIVGALEAGLRAQGLTLILANSRNDPTCELETVEAMRRQRVEGLILAPVSEQGNASIDALRRSGIPFVIIDRDIADSEADRVLIDHYPGVLAVTRHLLELGHRRIALVTPGANLRPARERIRAWRDAHTERGIAVDTALVCMAASATAPDFSAALDLFESAEPPTAVITLGNQLLAGVLFAIRRTGRSVPEDVSVVSLGDTDLARYGSPAISVLDWNLDAVGQSCARLIIDRLAADPPRKGRRELITTQLVMRESIASAHLNR